MTDKKFRIFTIDDSPMFQKVIGKSLADFDVEINYFTNPEEALGKVKDLSPDLILLDFTMPEFNGDEFMIKFSENLLFGEVSTFLVSSNQFSDDQSFGLKTLGIEKVFPKPFDDGEFQKAVAEKIEEWKQS